MRNPCLKCDNRDGSKNCAACLNCERRIAYVSYTADPDNYLPGRASAAGERSVMEPQEIGREAATESHVDDAPEPGLDVRPLLVDGKTLYGGQVRLRQHCVGLYDSDGNACGRFCSVCEKPLLFKDFYRSKHGTLGHQPHCKACDRQKTADKHKADKRIADKNKRKKAGRKAGDGGGRVEEKTAKQAPVKNWPAPEAGVGQKENKRVTLDFSHYPGLYLKLKEAAEKDFRTPELQALFLIFRGMKGSSCEWPQFVDYYKLNGQKIKAEMDLARAKAAYAQKAVADAKEHHGEDSAEYQKAVNKMAQAAEDLKEVSHEPTT